ncbi:MAG: tRNA pseudouridine(55) synthase TruB [Clostridiales bacterium]|jgi:tRNA pseudouridine55 synthase|nr:tRNA pseudouridine(55) synthase TruB [Clostridiales bacterium]
MTPSIGVINIYKEKGYTSHDVVNVVRRILRPVYGKIKVGHTGTLDPIAEGVLPVCIGKATKIAGLLQSDDKIYKALMRLGITTDTQDITGSITAQRKIECDEDTLKQVVSSFYGKQKQTPPMHSAVKINGRKLYEAARAGIEIDRPQREIFIYSIEVNNFNTDTAELAVNCGKGAYIRTLINDIGEKLGCGACMQELLRVKAGMFDVRDSIKLGELQALADTGDVSPVIKPIKTTLNYRKINAVAEADKHLLNGNSISAGLTNCPEDIIEEEKYFISNSLGEIVGIFKAENVSGLMVLKPEIMLI